MYLGHGIMGKLYCSALIDLVLFCENPTGYVLTASLFPHLRDNPQSLASTT